MVSWWRGGGEDARRLLVAGLLVVGMAALAVLAVSQSGDYDLTGALNGDNAAPGIHALVHGSIAGYVARQPLMGLTTILLRLPFAVIGSLIGGELTVYKLGAFACLLPLALAAAWLIAAPGISRRKRLLRLLTVAVVIGSPITRSAMQEGHPEDVVAATLATGAVLAASAGKVRWAAVLLALAIGAKEWAVIAIVPVLIALPSGRRLEAALITVALMFLLDGVVALADLAAFEQSSRAVGTKYLSSLSPLWPLATPIRLLGGGYVAAARVAPWGMTRTQQIAVQLSVIASVAGVWFLRVRRSGGRCEALRLLALLAAVRCICDPVNQQYYWTALLIPVATWESLEIRLPTLTILLSAIVWLLYDTIGHIPATLTYLAAITAYLALIAYLARAHMTVRSGALRSPVEDHRTTRQPTSPTPGVPALLGKH